MAPWKQFVVRLLNKAGYNLTKIQPNRLGGDPITDIRSFLRNEQPMIFDVGANVGQTIDAWCKAMPQCTIHSFEPSPTTYSQLSQNMHQHLNAKAWNFALGSAPGRQNFLENSSSVMSSFLPLGEDGWGEVTKETLVDIQTVDRFCADHQIDYIDVLKSDTQGFELEVFKGATKMLQSSSIGLLYFEVNFSRMYEGLPPFGNLHEFLTERGYILATLYDLHFQPIGRRSLAGWTDALYVNRSYL